jgi:hypothetical protein
MPKPALIKVFPNPHGCELDHEGRAHCHVHYQPMGNNSMPQLLGCRLIATKLRDPDPSTQLSGDDDHVYEYDTEPTVVPATAYYLHHLRSFGVHGAALLPADERTTKLVYGVGIKHRCPKARIAQRVKERGGVPRLKPSDDVLKAQADHETAQSKLAPGEKPKAFERDHVAEFEAWSGVKLTAPTSETSSQESE